MNKCVCCGKNFESSKHNKKLCSYECETKWKSEYNKLKSKCSYISKKTASNFNPDILNKILELKFICFSQKDFYKCPLDPENPEMFCGCHDCNLEIKKFGCSRCLMFKNLDR